jgi:biopolymer transport protein ExbD
VDTKNIDEATADQIANFEHHQNKAIEITGDEKLSFGKVVELMKEVLPDPYNLWVHKPYSNLL